MTLDELLNDQLRRWTNANANEPDATEIVAAKAQVALLLRRLDQPIVSYWDFLRGAMWAAQCCAAAYAQVFPGHSPAFLTFDVACAIGEMMEQIEKTGGWEGMTDDELESARLAVELEVFRRMGRA